MASAPSLESVQDWESSTLVSNELDTVFNFSQLEGKDAGQQVCRFYSCNQLPHRDLLHSQVAILNHMMGKAVSIKEGAEAVLHGHATQLTVSLS
jgi:hypothetical protein